MSYSKLTKWFAVCLLTVFIGLQTHTLQAQIFEPEGLNMPGGWNAWVNPPENNLALASFTQVTNGRVTKIEVGTPRWQTIFSVDAAGADLEGGSYDWLFTSGPEGSAFSNKWAGVDVDMNNLQNYTFQGGDDNSITLLNGHWYTMNWEDSGYENTRAIFMETSAEPVEITTVSEPVTVEADEPVSVSITTSAAPAPEELFYLRYTTDSWNSSAALVISMSGNSGTVEIPGQPEGTNVQYYAFSSTVASLTADYDLHTILLNNNDNENYGYTVEGTAPSVIGWANLQWPPSGNIIPGQEFNVFAQVFADGITNGEGQGTGIQAWIGYSSDNTDPATWTNWIVASYQGDDGNNDEYMANLGAELTDEGTYYYASRFQLEDQDFVYGGYSAEGGGFWNGTTNLSGVVEVNALPPDVEISWANLQWPPDGNIELGQAFDVFAQVYAEGVTDQTGQGGGIQAWIGIHTADTDPAGWTEWIPAAFNGDVGDNDEYVADIGTAINETGTYYYASRFQLEEQDYVYGGYSAEGGGFWDGTTHVSGVLTVEDEPPGPFIAWANLQWPPDGEIEPGQDFDVYAQVYAPGITDQAGQGAGIQAWIGYHTSNTNPAAWPNWVPAVYQDDVGDNDEYLANIGAAIADEGTYYYASRFQLDDQTFVYGGYSADGGGFWDGTTHVSGVLTVAEPQPDPDFDWVNLQWPGSGTIAPEEDFEVFAQAFIEGLTGPDGPADSVQAWIGYHSSNTAPDTWETWIEAPYQGADGGNDEFMTNIGPLMDEEGTYYYASRFQLDDGDFYYGGYSISGGGFWNGTTNVSGVLIVEEPQPDPEIDWANLQWPGSGTIEPGDDFDVFAQAYIEGETGGDEPAAGLEAWIGYSTENSNPNSWTNWFPAAHNGPAGDNDEFLLNLAAEISEEGTYYYASRFRLDEGTYVYGGFSAEGGGFWNGVTHVSGVLTVETIVPDPEIEWANLQSPASGEVNVNQVFNVFSRAFVPGITGGGILDENLHAWIGYSTQNTDPAVWTNWVPAGFQGSIGSNDQFKTNLGEHINEEGTYYYASRFKFQEGDFVYGGYSEDGGGFWDGTQNVSGVLTVTSTPSTWPVTFTIIDATETHTNIKLKGEMTDWATVPMDEFPAHTWTLSLQLQPGDYEWGAIEDDGTEFGIWLIAEPGNLLVSIDGDGNITGDTTYTTTVVSLSENHLAGLRVYPNPVSDMLTIVANEPVMLRITDLKGQTLLIDQNRQANRRISLSDFPSGIYLFEIRSENATVVKRIVKR